MLAIACLFSAKKGIPISTVGVLAARDSGFFGRIEREEASFTARKYDDVMGWLSDNWPKDVEWPADVPRLMKVSDAEAA